jgi:transposase-like protein
MTALSAARGDAPAPFVLTCANTVGLRKYTAEQKAEAMKLYQEAGPGEAARCLHIPMPTIASWSRRAGIQTDAPNSVKAAIEMARLSREQKRELLREKLLDQALSLVGDMDGTVLLITKKGEQLKLPASPSDKKDLAKAMRDVVETFRLEVGEST